MSSYPPVLKTVNKAVPCILMCLGMSTITWLYMHGVMRHSQDHVPKHTYRYSFTHADPLASKDSSDSEINSTEDIWNPESKLTPMWTASLQKKSSDFNIHFINQPQSFHHEKIIKKSIVRQVKAFWPWSAKRTRYGSLKPYFSTNNLLRNFNRSICLVFCH